MAKSRKKVEAPSFIDALNALEEEKHINKQVVLDALKEALVKSYKKNYMGSESQVTCEINEDTGEISLFEIMNVVDDVKDEDYELSLEEAQAIDPKYQVGDQVITKVKPEKFGRLAATQTKQLLRQKIREEEKESLYNEFADKKDDIVTGTVDRVEKNFAIININKTGAFLPTKNQIPGEHIYEGQRLKVYISEVDKTTKGTHIGVSRTDPGFVKRLFEEEVPEIHDGTVEIMEVSREAGERSKIAVYTSHDNIDPIGSCVGVRGTRVRNVVNELNGEMIDIILWDKDPVVFISHALSPANVEKVILNKDGKSALVIVPDNQLSLAIGKKGQNARLAVRLTKWKIDIKSVSEAKAENITYELYDEPYEEEALFDEEIFEEMIAETKQEPAEPEVEETVIEEAPMPQETPVVEESKPVVEEPVVEQAEEESEQTIFNFEIEGDTDRPFIQFNNNDYKDYDEYDDYDDNEEFDYEDEDEDFEDPDYDPKYDEDIDYDAYDEYYD